MLRKPVRCAIYTRKSTEEGLDQDFNSLDAQREAAEAFIKSQKHAGWILVSSHYDDGGYSGGSLDRPALQRLLADMEYGRLDCVVVYKVDRLSRSLLDFARLMDRFDQRSVSFVSVTQQFNTTTSLGRLTLNILLSFAQFEREIISERTRDKMSAARRKGKWVGGTPVLGYDVDPAGGRLIVNEREANRVREIFALYQSHRSIEAVLSEIVRRRWKTKTWKSKSGIVHAGREFQKTSLVRLLTHPIYAGKIEHRGTLYAGEHPAIIEPTIWGEVQRKLRQPKREYARRTPQNALLAGLLFCKHCNVPMIPTYTDKPGRRYRYYVCRGRGQNGSEPCPTKSVPAEMIERSLIDRLGTDNSGSADLKEFVRARVRQVVYDGLNGAVSVVLEDE